MLRKLFEKATTVSGSRREDARMQGRAIFRVCERCAEVSNDEIFADIYKRAHVTYEALADPQRCPDNAVRTMMDAFYKLEAELKHAIIVHNINQKRSLRDSAPKVSLSDVGRVIAGGIQAGYSGDFLGDSLSDTVARLKIKPIAIWIELVGLAAFSGDWGILFAMGGHPGLNEIRAGYGEQWEAFSRHNAAHLQAVESFAANGEKYARAVTALMQQEPGTWGNPLAETFATILIKTAEDHLPAEAGTDLWNADLSILAGALSLSAHDVCYRAAVNELVDRNLVKR